MTTIRLATKSDLPAIVGLLADDALGRARERPESPLPACYAEAFDAIARQAGNMVLVAERDEEIIGCLQLTLVANLTLMGATRAQIEGVRVAASCRGQGVGAALMRAAIERARADGARLAQLTTNRARGDAQRFYERLGFSASHVGMKLTLT
jgi:GNAT superfamily N-acetyltransferase